MTRLLKVVRIGNSRGVRLPAALLAKYRIGDKVSAEARPEGIVLKPVGGEQLSWEGTFKDMAAEAASSGDEFADLDSTSTDGLDHLDR
ncbi:MAG TPA: AbrB/MazE/SpoVT family DNA-binding domain-containing protein [Opitutaceae bacterium]